MYRTPRIAIVGAGPGGLTLARILHQAGIAATVFEREAGPEVRPQGGTLDLHEESGLLALSRAGLMEAFQRIARYEDQGSRLFDHHRRLLFEDAGGGGAPGAGHRPEVDRTALRAMLLEALPEGCVQWGCGLREVRAGAADTWNLVLEEGEAGPFDLVVGADGAWSRVRPLLSPYQPQYSGLTFIEFGIDDADARHPMLARLVGHGMMSVQGEGKQIIVQRNGHAHLRGYAIFRVPVDWAARHFDFAAPARVRAALMAQFAGYADAFIELFRAAGDRFAARPIHALPVGHCWANRRGLTLLGDAAHLMSPFGGEGVNAAMLDAAELGALIAARGNWVHAVASYEAQMFERIVEVAAGCAEAAAVQLSHDSLAITLEHFGSRHGDQAAQSHAAAMS